MAITISVWKLSTRSENPDPDQSESVPSANWSFPSHRYHVPNLLSRAHRLTDRKSTRLNSSHANISYAVFCLKKKKHTTRSDTSSGANTTGNTPAEYIPDM